MEQVTIIIKYGEETYKTLKEAMQAAKEGDVITVLKHATDSTEIAIDKNITINLNGYNIITNTPIRIETTGSLTIKGEGTITSEGTTIINTGILIIEDAIITSKNDTIINSGTVEVKSGKIISEEKTAIKSTEGTVTIGNNETEVNTTNPEVTGEEKGIEVTGGSFNFNNGVIKGKTDACNLEPSDIRNGYILEKGTDGEYKTIQLVETQALSDYITLNVTLSSTSTSTTVATATVSGVPSDADIVYAWSGGGNTSQKTLSSTETVTISDNSGKYEGVVSKVIEQSSGTRQIPECTGVRDKSRSYITASSPYSVRYGYNWDAVSVCGYCGGRVTVQVCILASSNVDDSVQKHAETEASKYETVYCNRYATTEQWYSWSVKE